MEPQNADTFGTISLGLDYIEIEVLNNYAIHHLGVLIMEVVHIGGSTVHPFSKNFQVAVADLYS